MDADTRPGVTVPGRGPRPRGDLSLGAALSLEGSGLRAEVSPRRQRPRGLPGSEEPPRGRALSWGRCLQGWSSQGGPRAVLNARVPGALTAPWKRRSQDPCFKEGDAQTPGGVSCPITPSRAEPGFILVRSLGPALVLGALELLLFSL